MFVIVEGPPPIIKRGSDIPNNPVPQPPHVEHTVVTFAHMPVHRYKQHPTIIFSPPFLFIRVP